MLIKDFLNSRDICPICQTSLELKIECDNINNVSLKLDQNHLNILSNYFNFTLDIDNNQVIPPIEFRGGIFNIKLKLFCPSYDNNLYKYTYYFSISCNLISFKNITELISKKEFSIITSYTKNNIYYLNHTNNNPVFIKYFDITGIPLDKLQEKIKLYLLFR